MSNRPKIERDGHRASKVSRQQAFEVHTSCTTVIKQSTGDDLGASCTFNV
jgi:hypothetical protein